MCQHLQRYVRTLLITFIISRCAKNSRRRIVYIIRELFWRRTLTDEYKGGRDEKRKHVASIRLARLSITLREENQSWVDSVNTERL